MVVQPLKSQNLVDKRLQIAIQTSDCGRETPRESTFINTENQTPSIKTKKTFI